MHNMFRLNKAGGKINFIFRLAYKSSGESQAGNEENVRDIEKPSAVCENGERELQ